MIAKDSKRVIHIRIQVKETTRKSTPKALPLVLAKAVH